MLQEFKDFALRGNVLDLAVGFIMGVAFSGIVTSLVNDIIMPPVGELLGGADFSDLFINLSGGDFDSLMAAQEAGASTINYGVFINALINFVVVAFAMFMLIKVVNRALAGAEDEEAPGEPTTKDCPYCFTNIAIKATRCPHCTSELAAAAS